MSRPSPLLKPLFVALLCSVASGAGSGAWADKLDDLFAELENPDTRNWQQVESEIWTEWSRSGSPAMDLLLQRGREALEAGDTDAAIDHLTALVDHAPDFAEGWNARATAYYQAGLFGPSIADIERALALNPRHFGALSGLGLMFEELDHAQAALKVYRAALALHPHLPNVTEAVDRLQRELGDRDV